MEPHEHPGWLSDADYATVLSLVPMLCVDFLAYRESADGKRDYAFISRDDEQGGHRFALVGGGVMKGETLTEAGNRHLHETLGPAVTWTETFDRAPDALLQYFPTLRPGFGIDTRKHSVGLAYLVRVEGDVLAGGEASAVTWFPSDKLPSREEFGFEQWRCVEDLLGYSL